VDSEDSSPSTPTTPNGTAARGSLSAGGVRPKGRAKVLHQLREESIRELERHCRRNSAERLYVEPPSPTRVSTGKKSLLGSYKPNGADTSSLKLSEGWAHTAHALARH
jgi:hypothetical protein